MCAVKNANSLIHEENNTMVSTCYNHFKEKTNKAPKETP
jgi:hypothetical protein